ncbi:hypothetical protein AB4254_15260 [Vibrio breoganii]
MYQFKSSKHSNQKFKSNEERSLASKKAFTAYCDVLRVEIEKASGQRLKRCKFRHSVVTCFNRIELGGLLWLESTDDTFKSEAAFLKSLQDITTDYENYTVDFRVRLIQLLSSKYGIKISNEVFKKAEHLAMKELYWNEEASLSSILEVDAFGY